MDTQYLKETEKKIFEQSPKLLATDQLFKTMYSDLQISLSQAKQCLQFLTIKIECVSRAINKLEKDLQKVSFTVGEKSSIFYEKQLKKVNQVISNFANFCTDLKIVEQKYWPIISEYCELYPFCASPCKNLPTNKIDNEISLDGDQFDDYDYQIEEERVFIDKVLTLPFLFGNQTTKNHEFFSKIN